MSDRIELPEETIILGTGREVRCFRDGKRIVWEVQPPRDNYWIQTPDVDRAVRIGNDCMTAADRRWLRRQS